jgi:predicted Na+-dependent transporter
MLQLCQTILVPTLLGASVRGLVPGAAAAIDSNKKALSYINAGLLASVPWMQVGGFPPFVCSFACCSAVTVRDQLLLTSFSQCVTPPSLRAGRIRT